MMTTLIPQLNADLSELADRVRNSLVQVTVGRRGSGSGVVFSDDGLVITNSHVVSGKGRRSSGDRLQVTLPDGAVVAGELLAKDEESDVAVLKIEGAEGNLPELHPIELGDSRSLRAGQWVMAMGHPWGVAAVAAGGIVIGAGPDLPEAPNAGRDWPSALAIQADRCRPPGPPYRHQHHDGRPGSRDGGSRACSRGVCGQGPSRRTGCRCRRG